MSKSAIAFRILRYPSVLALKLRSSSRSTSGPAPSDGREMGPQVAQHMLVDIELGEEWHAETRSPGVRLPALVEEDVGLERGKALVADFGAQRLDTVEAGNRRLEEARVIDTPGCAMRPIDPHTIAHLAAEQHITRHAQRLGLCVEQGVFDRTEPLADHPAGGRPGKAVEFRIDPLVVEDVLSDDPCGEPLDDRTDPGRTEAFIEPAPTDDAFVGGQLQEMIIPPAGIAAKDFEARHLHRRSPGDQGCRHRVTAVDFGPEAERGIATKPPPVVGKPYQHVVAANRYLFDLTADLVKLDFSAVVGPMQ